MRRPGRTAGPFFLSFPSRRACHPASCTNIVRRQEFANDLVALSVRGKRPRASFGGGAHARTPTLHTIGALGFSNRLR